MLAGWPTDLSFGRLSGHGVTEIDRSVVFDVLGLLTLPFASEVAQRQLEQAQYQAAFDAVGVAAEARKAFFSAVAAQDLVGYYGRSRTQPTRPTTWRAGCRRQATSASLPRCDASRPLCRRDEQSRAARHQAVAERERLVRALGLSGDHQLAKLPEHLPTCLKLHIRPRDARQTAIDKRLDVQMAKARSAQATAKSLRPDAGRRFINVLEAGYTNKSQTGEARQNGYEIQDWTSLFDFGATRMARAEAFYAGGPPDRRGRHQRTIGSAGVLLCLPDGFRPGQALSRRGRSPSQADLGRKPAPRYSGMLSSVFEASRRCPRPGDDRHCCHRSPA